MSKERNYWPHSIAFILFLGVIAGGWTIKIALDNPVEMDTFYLEKYQKVDENINDIIALQKEFDKAYAVEIKTKSFNLGKTNEVVFSILDKKTGVAVKADEINLLVTRPDTSKFDFKADKIAPNSNGEYAVSGIEAQKSGRWQILIKAKIGSLSGFYKGEVAALN